MLKLCQAGEAGSASSYALDSEALLLEWRTKSGPLCKRNGVAPLTLGRYGVL